MARIKDTTKVDAIFNATLKLVREEGLVGIKMSKVAKAAGIATGTLYIYFKNKEELIDNLYLKLKRESSERLFKDYSESMTLRQGFEYIWRGYFNEMISHPAEVIFIEQYYRSPFVKEEMLAERQALVVPVVSLLRKGKKEGIFRNDLSTNLMVVMLIGVLKELSRWHNSGRIKVSEEMKEKALVSAWRGLLA